jgi:hypothetical protein
MPQQRGCEGLVRWKLCCGLNFWFFWFKPKEHEKKKIYSYKDRALIGLRRILIFQKQNLTIHNPCFWRHIFYRLKWNRPKKTIQCSSFFPGVETPSYYNITPSGVLSVVNQSQLSPIFNFPFRMIFLASGPFIGPCFSSSQTIAPVGQR